MSQQQVTQQRSAASDGLDQHRFERDFSRHYDNSLMQVTKFHSINSRNADVGHISCNSMKSTRKGIATISKMDGFGSPLCDRFFFMTACLIGQQVEVQVKNGSIFSGVFHSTNAEKDYGVVLKMARLITDGATKRGKFYAASKAPIKSLIIPGNELVQVIAKDVPVLGDGEANGYSRGNGHDILTDSSLSHANHVVLERELEPWMPDKDAPDSLNLEDTFQSTWNRNWDQFETNRTLFGVESTFDEELYTTKLEKGPQMKDLEKTASKIATEIERQTTKNFHLAEERGTQIFVELDSLDEESRFSSVLVDDIGEDYEYEYTDNHNKETFGDDFTSTVISPLTCEDQQGHTSDAVDFEINFRHLHQPSSACSSEISSIATDQWEPQTEIFCEDVYNSRDNSCRKMIKSNFEENLNWTKRQLSDGDQKSFSKALEKKDKVVEPHSKITVNAEKLPLTDGPLTLVSNKENSAFSRVSVSNLPPIASAYAPPASSLPIPTGLSGSTGTSSNHTGSEGTKPVLEVSKDETRKDSTFVQLINSQAQMPVVRTRSISSLAPSSSASNYSLNVSVSSPSSSIGSMSLESSTLNPNAKEFKLNPNAKSFTPSYNNIRPSSPGQGPLHLSNGSLPVVHMQGLPVGFGASLFTHQPKQPASFGHYNNALAASGVTTTSYLQPAVSFSHSLSATNIFSSFPVQSPASVPLGQQVGQSLSVQPIVYNSQEPPLQSASAYIHPNSQLYPQQMMFGQHGQAFYLPPFPREMMQGPPLPQGLIHAFATQQSRQP